MINYYEVLEVSEKASKEVIEKAHKALAKKYHPDLNQDNLKEAEQKMKEINEAFEVIMDDSKRSNYDSILAKKREIEQRKASYSSQKTSSPNSNQQTADDLNKQFNNYNKISYSNGYYTDPNDNFFINTKNMDDKTRKKLQNKLQERYLEAYDSYLRERGYKLKDKWTFKRVAQLVLAILIAILICVILFFIPPIHKYCIDLYNENFVIKLIFDLIKSIFSAIFSIFE